jgi:CRP/FNR family transcriptional regulator, anaerobic regulatory protein
LISLDKTIVSGGNLQTIKLSFDVYVASEGALCCFRPMPGGRRSILQFIFKGDGFGYESGDYYRNSVQALTRTEVVATAKKDVVAASKAQCAAAFFAAAERAVVIAEEQSYRLRRSATERTALFLLEMHARLSIFDEIFLPMSRTDISDYLGLAIETVSRVLNEFQRENIIEICHHLSRQIIIRNKARLEELALDASKFEWWNKNETPRLIRVEARRVSRTECPLRVTN